MGMPTSSPPRNEVEARSHRGEETRGVDRDLFRNSYSFELWKLCLRDVCLAGSTQIVPSEMKPSRGPSPLQHVSGASFGLC
ncbi:unnamed protein product [Gadus morhua 'NCC']